MEQVVRAGNRRRLMRAKAPRTALSTRQCETFLSHLAESCNVTWSAAQAGLVCSTVYRLRARDEAFAAAWQEALTAGYQRLEMGLVQAALALVEGRPGAAVAGSREGGEPGPGSADEKGAKAARAAKEGAAPEPDAAKGGDEGRVIAPMTVDQAISLLGRHQASVRGGRARTLRPDKRMPTSEETDAAILKRLAILRRQRGLAPEG
ncbi:MAG: hypothetical protein WA910_08275 [Sphingopyxis granuli]